MMQVNQITAQVQYSQDTGHGAWKAVEIGAEATVDERERWAEALAHLYSDLGRELNVLWASGNGHKPQESPQDAPVSPVAVPQPVWNAPRLLSRSIFARSTGRSTSGSPRAPRCGSRTGPGISGAGRESSYGHSISTPR